MSHLMIALLRESTGPQSQAHSRTVYAMLLMLTVKTSGYET